MGRGNRIVVFEEKQNRPGCEYMNAGIYMLSREILYDIPAGIQVSLEHDMFPRWLQEGKHIQSVIDPGKCIDIGTPERYWLAQTILAMVEQGGSVPF